MTAVILLFSIYLIIRLIHGFLTMREHQRTNLLIRTILLTQIHDTKDLKKETQEIKTRLAFMKKRQYEIVKMLKQLCDQILWEK